jgi:vitamin B12 transporter
MPTADELFMYNDYSAWGFGIWSGNPNLKPEKSKTYEMGVDFSRGSCSSGLTYFHTEFKDKISYAYDAVAGVTRYENIKGATIAGIEGTFNIDIGEIFDWNWELKPYASFTYLTKYWDDQNNVNLSYNPEWTASYGVKLSKPKIGFDSKLNFAFFSEQDITDYEGTGDKTLAAYTVADLTVSKELFSFDRFGRVVLKGDVSNLFNKDYAVVQGYPSPGRTFYVGLKYEY